MEQLIFLLVVVAVVLVEAFFCHFDRITNNEIERMSCISFDLWFETHDGILSNGATRSFSRYSDLFWCIYRLDLMYDRFLNKKKHKKKLRQNIFTAEYSKCRHIMASMQSRQTNIENNYWTRNVYCIAFITWDVS